MIAFIRSFMVQSFKDNPNLKQAVVIGILKVAQESIFSDFNNPAVSTLLDPEMEDCFGFTEPEVEAMADYYGLGDKMDGIREWYNGYIFGGGHDHLQSLEHNQLPPGGHRLGCVPTGCTPVLTGWSRKRCS